MATKAAALTRAITKTVRRTESPPTWLASACTAVATGPYTLGVLVHSSTRPMTGSAGRSAGTVRYGSWPRAAIRPYAA
ncbi:hypothetical protein Mro03_43810 [Microbispora rosea subsp. rosea]|nr:hypothetical protein Mro03_43810 [Microbispora rosea subsp. rosea]